LAGTACCSTVDDTGCVNPFSTRLISSPKSTVISTSAGERVPSAATRSARPSRMKMLFTLIPVVLLKASMSGWIKPGSRVV